MTYENALKQEIKLSPIQARNDLERYLLRQEPPIPKSVAMGMQALEKQIPQKVTHEATIYSCCTCPNCKNVVDEFTEYCGKKVRVTYAYCRYCGQALDWGDE